MRSTRRPAAESGGLSRLGLRRDAGDAGGDELGEVGPQREAGEPAPERRRLSLAVKIAGGVVLVVLGALLTRQIGSVPTAAPPPATPGTAAPGTAAPQPASVQLTSVRVIDQGRKVTLAWRGAPGMSYAVIVAVAGRSAPSAKLVNQDRTRTFTIVPGQQYCFQVQGSFDGTNAVQSAPQGINGARCQG